MIRCLTRTLMVFFILLVAALVLAGITSITVEPEPIVVGTAATYTAHTTSELSAGFRWDYRCTDGGTNGPWMPDPPDASGSPEITYHEARIGAYDVRSVWSYYEGPPYEPPKSDTFVQPVTVWGPNADVIASGLDVESTGFPRMDVRLRFLLKRGGTTIGPYVEGYPQENLSFNGGTTWTGWQGPLPGAYFWESASCEIVDVKYHEINDPDWWNGIDVGTVLNDYLQRNRMVIKDCHGNDTAYEFPQRRFKHIKTGPQSFKVTLVP